MTWTAANDRKLLLLALGREIRPHEYATIAASFPGKELRTPFFCIELTRLL